MHDPLKQEEEKYKKYNHLFTANLKFLLNNKFFFLFLFRFFSYDFQIWYSERSFWKKRDIIPFGRINFYSLLTRTRIYFTLFIAVFKISIYFSNARWAPSKRDPIKK